MLKLILISACFFLLSNKSPAQAGYVLTFACCFENDSVVVVKNDTAVYKDKITTDPSTSIASSTVLLQAGNRKKVIVVLPGKNKQLKMTLPKLDANQIKYVYVYFDKSRLVYRVLSQPLRAY